MTDVDPAREEGERAARGRGSADRRSGGDKASAPSNDGPPVVRPQTLLLLFCGVHLAEPGTAISTTGLVEVLCRVDVGEYAARSTVSRMIARGTLERRKVGRDVYLAPSASVRSTLHEGGVRAWQSPVNRDWDGQWTLLGFSLPESRRADRHLLRSRLQWAGFGLLQNGLWVAPRQVDVEALLAELELMDHVRVFRAALAPPTTVAELVDDAWDLPALAERYRTFLHRWDRSAPLSQVQDDLARQLWLLSEWTVLARNDPGLPVEHLPADWPAGRAEHVALQLRDLFEPGARTAAADLVVRPSDSGGGRGLTEPRSTARSVQSIDGRHGNA
jgi:phenylacetic acid degradation operon negative regulatory protein